jgi:two-component system, OmpR family, sensor histidine kinase CiaH
MASRGRRVAEPAGTDVFARARRRLALLFTALVVVLVVVSSVFMYLTVQADIRTAASGSYPTRESEQAFVSASLGSLRWQLLVVDAAIVIVVGVGGLLYARSTLRPIRENVAAQKRFVADASHDLRTPLAIMRAEFEVALRRPDLEESTRPLLVSGLEEVERMSGMVDDLLTLSRIDAHQEPLAREPMDLVALARQTVDELGALAATGGVALQADAAGEVPAVGDEGHVRRALGNVLRNAVEHSPAGATVEVRVRRWTAGAEVVVTDHGEGMSPEVLEHVFDRFYRGDQARSRVRGGSGLGLAIARWALRGMGGDLTAESEVGVGTRMTLTLPAA